MICHPLWVGIGCERGTPTAVFAAAIQAIFRDNHLKESSIAGIATIDTKRNEAGLVTFCRDRLLPLRVFSAEQLSSVVIPTPSTVVAASVGTSSVAEAAALLACQEFLGDRAGSSILCVPKQVCRLERQPGAVTVAVARQVGGMKDEG